MSTGKLCNHSIDVSLKINGENDITLKCDLWYDHDCDHSAMIYHCVDRKDSEIFKDNYRLGRISWKNDGYGKNS